MRKSSGPNRRPRPSGRTRVDNRDNSTELKAKVEELEHEVAERERAEEALRQSEGRYRELVDNAASIILRWDKNGCITFFNEFAQQFFGYSEQEILGKHVVGTIVPETEETGRDLKPLMDDIAAHPERHSYNVNENMRRGGERVWVAWTNRALKDDNGNVGGVLSVGVDITERREIDDELSKYRSFLEASNRELQREIAERKRAEEQLRQSTEQLQTLTEEQSFLLANIHDFAYRHDVEGTFHYLSPSVELITGHSVEDWKNHYSTYHSDNPINDHVVEYTERALATGEAFPPYIVEIIHKDGHPVLLEVNERPYKENGLVQGMVGVARDVTEKVRAEEEIKRSAERISALSKEHSFLLDNIRDFVYRHDTEGVFYYLSPAVEKITGYTVEEWKKHYSTYLTDNPVNDLVKASTDTALRTGEACPAYEAEIYHRDGSRVTLEISEQPYFENGEVVGIVGVARDVTERKKTEGVIKSLVEVTAGESGEAFFQTLVRRLSSVLGVRYALVGESMESNPNRISTCAVCDRDEVMDSFEYDLNGTPCYNVVAKNLCYYPENVSEKFPEDHLLKEMNVASYMGAPLFDSAGRPLGLLAVMHDARMPDEKTARDILLIFASRAGVELERKRAESSRMEHITFLENMDRVDRAMQKATSLEQLLNDVLDTMRSILGCDRAWLLYPCNPDAPSWAVPMESTSEQYPGAKDTTGIPMEDGASTLMSSVLASTDPLCFGPGNGEPLPETVSRFLVRSQMAVSVRPPVDEAWMLGVHQCSRERVWTEEERRLFKEIARRLADSLSSMLSRRDLRASEERFRATFEQAAVGVAHVAIDGRFLKVNQKLCDILGYSQDEMLSLSVPDIEHPEDFEKDRGQISQLLAGAIDTYSMESRCIRKDGSAMWVNLTVSLVRGSENEPKYVISVLEDITERKRAAQDLVENEQRLRSLSEAAFEGICIHDNGILVQANPAFCQIFGYTPDELVGKDAVKLFLPPEDRPVVMEKIHSRESKSYETTGVRRDGTKFPMEVRSTPTEYQGRTVRVAAVRDLTEKKRAAMRNETILKASIDGFCVVDIGGRILEVNDACCRMLGHSRNELLSMDLADLDAVNTAQDVAALLKRVRQLGQHRFESCQKRKDGTLIDLDVSANFIDIEGGRIFVFARDITDRKKADDALKASHQQLLDIIEFLPDATFVIDKDKKVIAWNRALEEMTGIDKTEMLGRGDYIYSIPFYGKPRPIVIDLIGVDDKETESLYDYVDRVNDTLTAEVFVPRLFDGKGAYVRVVASPLLDTEGNRYGAIESVRDITAQKLAEESTTQLGRMLEDSLNEIYVFDSDSLNFVQVNRGARENLGYTIEELKRLTPLDLKPEFTAKSFSGLTRPLRDGDSEQIRFTTNHRRKDGSLYPVDVSLQLSSLGERSVFVANILDITRRRAAEKALRQSEEKYRTLFDHSADAILIIDGDRFIDCNDATVKMLRYNSKQELLDTHPSELSPERQPDGRFSYEKANKMMSIAYENGSHRFEWDHKRADGEVFPVEVLLTSVPVGDRSILHVVWRDITDRKRAESERDRLFNHSVDMLCVAGFDGFFRQVNPAWTNALGWTVDELTSQPYTQWVHPDDIESTTEAMDTLSRGEPVTAFENRYRCKDGSYKWISWNSFPMPSDEAIFAVARDVTERIASREALLESEERYRELVEGTDALVAQVNDKGVLTFVNDAANRVFGLPPEACVGLSAFDFIHPDDVAFTKSAFEQWLKNRTTSANIENRQVSRSGEVRDMLWTVNLIYDDDGNVVTINSVARDITDRKRTEEALRDSEERFRTLVEASSDWIWEVDRNGIYTYVSPKVKDLLGYDPIEVLGRTPFDFMPTAEASRVAPIYEEIVRNRQPIVGLENRNLHKDGREVTLETNGVPWIGERGQLIGYRGVDRDITERKRAEEIIQSRLDSLTRPVSDTANLTFTDLFDLEEIQKVQDSFARATGVASIITDTDGKPITKPSNFCRLCIDIIRCTEKGLENCMTSDAELGKPHVDGPRIKPCLSGGLWDGGASVVVGGKHIANWLIGQVRNEAQNIDRMLDYAREIGADEDDFRAALDEVPIMPIEQFREACQALHLVASQLSQMAYHNVQQARAIAERKRAESALSDEKERLAVTLASIGDGVIATDQDGSIVVINRVACDLTGFREDEALGRPLSEVFKLLDDQSRVPVISPFDRVLESNSIVGPGLENTLISRDGIERAISHSGAPIRDRDGNIAGVVLAFSDITETRRLQDLSTRAQRLETAGTIAGQVAHDFNNLLAPVMSYPELIRGILPAGHQSLQYINQIEKCAEQMAEINQQLLTLGRRGHYTVEPLNLNDVVKQVIGQNIPESGSIQIRTNLSDGLLNLKGGHAQIFRVVSNLVANAVDALKGGGELTIRTENYYVEDRKGRSRYVPRGEYIKLTISDTGTGILPDVLPRIFDAFFTTKTAAKRRGSGLGLSVVHSVLEDHDAYIDLCTETGKGTSFYLYFPVTRDTLEPLYSDELIGGTETVLVVDDDELQRDVTCALCKKLGYQATAVASGEEAVEFLRHTPQELMILDMIMPPGIDGTETFRRALEVNPEQKAFFVSGYAESDRVREAQGMGAGSFVRKPLTLKALAAAARRELDRARQPG